MESVPIALHNPFDAIRLISRRPQGWVDNKESIRHREMLSRLFCDAAIQGRLGEIDPSYIYGLLQISVRVSLSQSIQLLKRSATVPANVVYCSYLQAGSTTTSR